MGNVVNDLTMYIFIKNPLFYIFIIVVIIIMIFNKKIIGGAGEYWVKKELKQLNRNRYLIINNLTIKSNNKTHQIDHVVISKYGIFVIETKQYNGYIKGNEYDKKWVQNNKYYINNPIHQNYGHVKCLEETLKLPESSFIPIVCIPSRANLNIKALKNKVVRCYDLNNTILSYTKEIIEDHYNLYNQLLELNRTDKETKKEHINHVKQINRMNEYDSNKCPQCGGDLVKREGKYGEFIGCKNYPKCRYTKRI